MIVDTHTDEPTQLIVSKLESLTLSRLDLFDAAWGHLLYFIQGGYDREIYLKELIVRSCRVYSVDSKFDFEDMVGRLEWDGMKEVYSDDGWSDMWSDEFEYAPYRGAFY